MMNMQNTKYKIYYQENGKIKTTLSDNLSKDNIISYKKISKKFKLSNSEIFSFLKDIKNLLLSNIDFFTILRLVKNGKNKKIVEFLEKNYNQFLPNDNLLFLFINFNKTNTKSNLYLLYKFLEQKEKIINNIFDSLKYPLFLITLLIFLFISTSSFLLPKVEIFYQQNNISLPIYSKILLQSNKFFIHHQESFYITIISIFTTTILLYLYKKDFFDKMMLKIKIVRYFYFYKAFSLLQAMIGANFSFYNSLKEIAKLESNLYIKQNLLQISNNIKSGIKFEKAINNNLFDEMAIKLLISGYYADDFEKALTDCVSLYKNNIDKSIEFFKTYLNPIMLLIIFLSILFLILAIFMPIWDIGQIMK